MKNLLIPRVFYPIGWTLFTPAFIAGLIYMLGISGIIDLDFIDISGIQETIALDAIIIGIALGALFIVSSRKPIEDEMTKSVRLKSLFNSIYFYVGLLVMCTLFINGIPYILFTFANLALFPIIFVISFRVEMNRYAKITDDEE